MHKVTFHPLGNADCSRIDLENGRKILIDYADMRDATKRSDKRIDLPAALRADLSASGKDGYDTTAFTHLDDDHIHGASDFFYFDYAKKFQSSDRVRMGELWVPAAVILETSNKNDALAIQKEAKHRLREGYGIQVFSTPKLLNDWFKAEGIDPKDRAHLITNAGELAKGYSLANDGVEFFCHSPFATRSEQGTLLDRNKDSLALHATFLSGGQYSRALFLSDLSYDVIAGIVDVTEFHARNNPSRLQRLWWDIQKISHHCSYTSLGPEKGKTKTKPDESVDRLFKTYGQKWGIVVSTSKPIPSDDSDDQPPHRQAANYYREVAGDEFREFVVTMEHPTKAKPTSLVVKIDSGGVAIEKQLPIGSNSIVSAPASRAGGR